MAAEPKSTATEEVKMDLFEDDDEFEEFEIDLGKWNSLVKSSSNFFPFDIYYDRETMNKWDDEENGKESLQQWEDDWDDDDVNDDFSLQLRRELESTNEKNN